MHLYIIRVEGNKMCSCLTFGDVKTQYLPILNLKETLHVELHVGTSSWEGISMYKIRFSLLLFQKFNEKIS